MNTNEIIIIPSEIIEKQIFLIRGQKVMIDKDLAFLYKVETKEQSKEILKDFPPISCLN